MMDRTDKFFRTMPAYALCVCLALSCSRADLQPMRITDNAVCEIGFSVMDERAAETRGVPVTPDNIASLYADNLRVVALRDGEEYIPSQLLRYSSGEKGGWHTSRSYFWPEEGGLEFWAWAPADLDAVFDGSRSALSFSYTLPTPDAEAGQDAVAQRDIILAHLSAERNTYGGGVPLTFSHPLSLVAFRGEAVREGVVRSISLRNVAGGGKCAFDGSGFVWTATGDLLTFTQIFNAPVGASVSPQPITMAGQTAGERHFAMIPQTLGDGAVLDVVFDDGVEVSTFTHSLAGEVWKAGVCHTYSISLSPGSSKEITVEEVFDGRTKARVAVSNGGSRNVYVRAMIEANWVDADGCIVAPCDIRKEGTVLGFNVSSVGGRWTAHSDGFCYYKKAVRPGHRTVELFASYTPGPAPVSGSHLEITIATQAVEYEGNQKSATEAWGNGIPITGAVE